MSSYKTCILCLCVVKSDGENGQFNASTNSKHIYVVFLLTNLMSLQYLFAIVWCLEFRVIFTITIVVIIWYCMGLIDVPSGWKAHSLSPRCIFKPEILTKTCSLSHFKSRVKSQSGMIGLLWKKRIKHFTLKIRPASALKANSSRSTISESFTLVLELVPLGKPIFHWRKQKQSKESNKASLQSSCNESFHLCKYSFPGLIHENQPSTPSVKHSTITKFSNTPKGNNYGFRAWISFDGQ